MSTVEKHAVNSTTSDTTPTTTTDPTLTAQRTTNPTITIRHATFFDLWPASRALARAFALDPLFGGVIHPHRHRHPSDPAWWFYQRLLRDWFDPSQIFLIATTSSSTIAGVAQWTRLGARPSLRAHGWAVSLYDPRSLLFPLLRLLTHLLAPVFRTLNRALDPRQDTIIEDADQIIGHHWTGVRSESFLLHFLGVVPELQNRGIGRDLVAWGMRKSRDEKVSVSVVAAAGKDAFYQHCGFDVCVGSAGDGEGNPIGVLQLPPDHIWFRDWEGIGDEK